MEKLTRDELLAAAQLELDHLASAGYFIYRDLFDWFGPAMVAAGYKGERTYSPDMQAIRRRADAAWHEITNLAPLHTSAAWNHAAQAAGWNGRSGDIQSAKRAILAWTAAKLANMPPGSIARLQNGKFGDVKDPLTDQQQEAFDYIREHGPKSGKEICNAVGITSESTFTRHYVPALQQHGVRNKRGAGYYV